LVLLEVQPTCVHLFAPMECVGQIRFLLRRRAPREGRALQEKLL
jgi:hypothetical protein